MDQFEIVDVIHCESFGLYPTLADAWAQLGLLAACAWDAEPNVAPCGDWETCGREYEIVAYDTTTRPRQVGRRYRGLSVNREGVTWGPDAPEAVVTATASAQAPGLRL